MKLWLVLATALTLGGCLADARQPDPTSGDQATRDDRPAHHDRGRDRCFATSVAGQPENVCY